MNKIFLNKRGQVGETITWIVATVIIIFILGTTLFVAEFSLAKNKEVSQTTQVDILVSKSFFSYLLTPNENGNVYGEIKNEGNLSMVNGNLALEIFEEFYGKEYFRVWLGMRFNRTLSPYKSNDYFGHVPIGFTGGDVGGRSIPIIILERFHWRGCTSKPASRSRPQRF